MRSENLTDNGECDIIGNTLMKSDEKDLSGITRKDMKSGVYRILNKINGKYYIGSSNYVRRRLTRHRNDLNNNAHINTHLQRAWNKYGECNFDFSTIEFCSKSKLLFLEKKYLGDINENVVYNLEPDPTRPFHSKETRMKISKSLMGHPCSTITKIKMKQAHVGNKNSNYKSTIYNFLFIPTGELFRGTMYEWRTKFEVPISNACLLTNGRLKTSYGWKLV
jgi:hypothetical protein